MAKKDGVAPKPAGVEAKFGFKAGPHMLMHARGYALANKGTTPARCRPISATRTS